MIIDVAVVNRGTCRITSAAFPYYFIAPGTITSSWNLRLDSPQGYGSVVLYGSVNPGSVSLFFPVFLQHPTYRIHNHHTTYTLFFYLMD